MKTFPVLAVLGAVALAGCGGSHPSADTNASSSQSSGATGSTGSGTTATSSTSATTSTPTTSTASTSTTTTSASGGTSVSGPHCTAADLSLSFLGMQGATGHGELGFALRNTSSALCHTYGYPGVQFLDGAGKPLATASTRTHQDFFGTSPVVGLSVPPGSTVSFRLAVSHLGPGACSTAYGLSVIPPDDTASLHVTIPGGAAECGTAEVSPLRDGVTAYP